ncbi:RHH-type transcriptional regulator, proline utilization regulon repressor / proline dehydrogenase / delta 1-pyrroline-5-carboxylate dehydrogenase [Ketogulonicigenium robustum]|uniref:Bifunctional protein PutA n=1 Tax=Ketogulonicigenium robustum TaxID=92947 RepID=A0A1W6P123_9RHOB|nr:bifunctional proline dehydrogenase/L-glutamate gamma-semialdehyde dehydrogenase PutA [Ketogulonicigenium robustum]ARO15149.1 RHH-type transcriptional regulator, proline utilization regulon repressor / proline dehydrogenase / delta 1-pyrroline-5-carboxylate dehydrogenase [Ketogulonicigenium robustum]
MSSSFPALRTAIDQANMMDEALAISQLSTSANLTREARAAIVTDAAALVRQIRAQKNPGLMETILAEYGLGSDEGLALMSMAEALLRIPDAATADALIADKIVPANWASHNGKSPALLVNSATIGLILTSNVLNTNEKGAIRRAIRRLGAPVIRAAVGVAMREMGKQFVLGQTIEEGLKNAEPFEKLGFTNSYDMLGEAARTQGDADKYFRDYEKGIAAIATRCTHGSFKLNPGISIKLSALHPRYEIAQRDRVMAELAPRVLELCRQAKAADMGLSIDAEEADRLQLSLDVIEWVLSSPDLAGWDGFGIVVQAYGKRVGAVIDYLYALATALDRKIMIRLVKGAYWDAEIKRAQVEGLVDFPVYTRKHHTDISYIANARKLLGMTDRVYPQFAGHNAHTVTAILHLAKAANAAPQQWEFQRLHGMGESLHKLLRENNGTSCRTYAPVGKHVDLLAYLVRRLLENGANSSFVNQIVDETIPPETVVTDPFGIHPAGVDLPAGPTLFGPQRKNSAGFDLTDLPTLAEIEAARAPFETAQWTAAPRLANGTGTGATKPVLNPATLAEIGTVTEADAATCAAAFDQAAIWDAPVATRAAALRRAADLYEENYGEFFALLAREAGKTLPDAVAELREAVDFLRYYANEAENAGDRAARGTWVCISPWNFPLAIFSGQIGAALAAGNAVIAKPAPQTPLIADKAVALLLQAGVPASALQLMPGGAETGAALTSSPRLAGVAFTGSTGTAQAIRRTMAENAAPGTPLIAETGGINAMIVDSTALPEAAVRDIVASAFRSAGQRCSALRVLYVQEDVAPRVTEMLKGAMEQLSLDNPWDLDSDVGPLIDGTAQEKIAAHVNDARLKGRLLHQTTAPAGGHFLAPAMIQVSGITAIEREIFGPVLHVATFRADQLDQVVTDINASGYGLTFGLHTRLQSRVESLSRAIHAGNIYVNRNQIGAVVGSQPFGGEGLSGTGPKAGGPNYLPRFAAPTAPNAGVLDTLLPGPTGESNEMILSPRGAILCAGPTPADVSAQVAAVTALGGLPVTGPADLVHDPLAAVLFWGEADAARAIETQLAQRPGAIVPLIASQPDIAHVMHERHICIDTTAAGGNAQLLAEVSGPKKAA